MNTEPGIGAMVTAMAMKTGLAVPGKLKFLTQPLTLLLCRYSIENL